MKVLVTGADGQLGFDLVKELERRNIDVIGAGRREMDITDPIAVKNVMRRERPDAVIHCAAWTAVDAAEEAENADKVRQVNVVGTENIARECANCDCKMLYVSTDYVFDGKGSEPWQEDSKDFNPLNFYGQTKLDGEKAVERLLKKYFIVRIAWVFGINGKNFVKTMLSLGEKYSKLRVVNDQIGTPTYTRDLAVLLVDMIQTDKYGCYHATNEGGYISWYDFAKEIFASANLNVDVEAVTTEQYGLSKAARPSNSRLEKKKLVDNGFELLPDWKDALARYIKEIKENGKN